MQKSKIKRIAYSPIADFISSFVLRKHGLKRDPSLFWENEVTGQCTTRSRLFTFSKQNLVKMACFEKFYRPKIHLEAAQKLPNDHLADEANLAQQSQSKIGLVTNNSIIEYTYYKTSHKSR